MGVVNNEQFLKRSKYHHSRVRTWKWSNKTIYDLFLPPFPYFCGYLHNVCMWDRNVPISSIYRFFICIVFQLLKNLIVIVFIFLKNYFDENCIIVILVFALISLLISVTHFSHAHLMAYNVLSKM